MSVGCSFSGHRPTLYGRPSNRRGPPIHVMLGVMNLCLGVWRWLICPIRARKVLVQYEQGRATAFGDVEALLFLPCLRCSANRSFRSVSILDFVKVKT